MPYSACIECGCMSMRPGPGRRSPVEAVTGVFVCKAEGGYRSSRRARRRRPLVMFTVNYVTEYNEIKRLLTVIRTADVDNGKYTVSVEFRTAGLAIVFYRRCG